MPVAMKLIPTVETFSERNVLLQQQRLYDADSLEAELRDAGLEVTERGGHFMKPFTNAQMQAIRDGLGDAVIEGLFRLGRDHPEWSAEIFCEARLPTQG